MKIDRQMEQKARNKPEKARRSRRGFQRNIADLEKKPQNPASFAYTPLCGVL